MELRKEAKYPTKKTTELSKSSKSKFGRKCYFAAVQKGHMIEQVINKGINVSVKKFTKQLTQRKRVVDSLIYRKD